MKTIPEKTKWGVVLMENKNTTEKVIEKIASQNGSAPSTNGHSCGGGGTKICVQLLKGNSAWLNKSPS
ncbi:hypothetical protein T10_13084 [Trichinella papuae]|uniref:Uncharacterized protein n=1 Tax=Trichinella papuae TaxID=268474 RepID=A0A0V1M0G9_9BILA|nr:hypothetical protein T10_13084 [Trichinella papuae]